MTAPPTPNEADPGHGEPGTPSNYSVDLYKLRPVRSLVVHAFDVLGDPVRRRILELPADGEQTSGAATDVIRAEFGISQPAPLREVDSRTERT